MEKRIRKTIKRKIMLKIEIKIQLQKNGIRNTVEYYFQSSEKK